MRTTLEPQSGISLKPGIFSKFFLEFCAIRPLLFILERIPFSLSFGIAKLTGGLFYLLAPGRKKIGRANLERVYGNTLPAARQKTILKKSFENAALSILELFLTRKMKTRAEDHFVIHGKENLEAALAPGKGAVLITSHLGSWEYLGFLFYLTKIRCSPIVKKIKNGYLDREIDSLRREMTLTPIPKKNAIRETLSCLKKNQVVAVLIDQWAGPEGLWIDFMGSLTATTSLPARLASKTGCALVPAYCLRNSAGQYEIQVQPAIAFPPKGNNWEWDLTQKLNRNLEAHIRRYPEQWSWAHRRWKPKPSTSRQTIPK